MQKRDIKKYSISGLKSVMEELSLEPYRADQMLKWLYQNPVDSFLKMSNFKKELRDRFDELFYISKPELVRQDVSNDGCTKHLLMLEDKSCIESVVIPDTKRNTVCVSSQAGCYMGCAFCLTAKQGFTRNLTIGEILDQALFAKKIFANKKIAPGKITNIVFMGMGEPLINLDNVVDAIDILTSDSGFKISARRITVSTCGITPKLIELCKRTDVSIAVSLNAADDLTRTKLMPVNKKYPLKELIETCKGLPIKKRARVTFEYVLINGVNDSISDAKKLTRLLSALRCKINLIPFNEHSEFSYKRPSDDSIERFQTHLIDKNFTAIIRTSRGGDISAACGQLRASCVHDFQTGM